MCIIPFTFYKPLVFTSSNSMTTLVEYWQGWFNWVLAFIIILTNSRYSRLDMELKVIGAKIRCLLLYGWHINPSTLTPFFTILLNPPISCWIDTSTYIGLAYTVVLRMPSVQASALRVKKYGRKDPLYLHRIMGMFFSITKR